MAEEFEFGDLQPEEPRSNRTFMIAAGVLGGLVIVSLILLALYSLFLAPSNNGQSATQTALALTAVAQAQQPSQTPRPTFTTIPTAIPTQTATLGPPTETPTQIPTRTPLPSSTPSGLPTTGFADEFGIPGLFVMGIALLVVVVLVRRTRFGISD